MRCTPPRWRAGKALLNFQQLRSVRETTRQRYNLTEVAQALRASQPGISRQIRELESELGVALFQREGKRLVGLTAPGERMLPIVERLLQSAEGLRRAGRDYARERSGQLTVATTHAQARYALPHAVCDFRAAHPGVQLQLRQGSPQQVARWLLDGEADIGIATEALAQQGALATLPCHHWTHVVLVPPGHALVEAGPLTLATLARHPLISYESSFSGRSHIDEAFSAAGLKPDFTLVAMDADVIKTYVRLGLGVGIMAALAYRPERDAPLVALDARHLFAANLTRLAVRRGALLRDIDFAFIGAFAAPLTREVVQAALSADASAAG
jgi:LysR family cys regulon transcriptional activator